MGLLWAAWDGISHVSSAAMIVDRSAHLLPIVVRNIYFLLRVPKELADSWLNTWELLNLAVEITRLDCPEPEIGDLLVVKFGIADVAVTGDQDDMSASRGSRVLRAHEHFALVF